MGTGVSAVSGFAQVTLARVDAQSPAEVVLSRQSRDRNLGRFCLGPPVFSSGFPVLHSGIDRSAGWCGNFWLPLLGAVLLLAFALGRFVPIALGARAVDWSEGPKPLARFSCAFERLGCAALIVSGLYLLNAYFLWSPAMAG